MILAIIIPAFNEEVSIAKTVIDYRAAFPDAKLVVVDNNSTDKTAIEAARVLDPRRDILMSEYRQGKGYAVKAALSRIEADIYLMTDGDATYEAADAAYLFEKMLKSRADMLVGDRVSGGAYDAQNTRLGHGIGNKLLTWVISTLAGQSYSDVLSGLRIMSRPFVMTIDVRSEGFQLETELNVIAAYLRANVIEVPISYVKRAEGSNSKLNTLKDGARILKFAIINWIAFAPLQPFLIVAIFSSFGSVILLYRVLSGFLHTGWPYTTTATVAAAAGIISILALFTGLSLKILGRNERRREIASFLEAKRKWNTRLDHLLRTSKCPLEMKSRDGDQ